MMQIQQIYTDIIKIFSKPIHQRENRKLLAQINKVYKNGYDLDEKRLLEAYRKSFRKLIKDKW